MISSYGMNLYVNVVHQCLARRQQTIKQAPLDNDVNSVITSDKPTNNCSWMVEIHFDIWPDWLSPDYDCKLLACLLWYIHGMNHQLGQQQWDTSNTNVWSNIHQSIHPVTCAIFQPYLSNAHCLMMIYITISKGKCKKNVALVFLALIHRYL